MPRARSLAGKRQKAKAASSPVRAVVGLRNPGADYEGTRHNLGYEVVGRVLDDLGLSLGRAPRRLRGLETQWGAGEERVLFFVPNSFMNESGGPVKAALDYYGIHLDDLLVVHDDIDLPFGRLRLQVGGGSGGHNGVRSLEKALGSNQFSRLKVGVGRPPGDMDPADYVLSRFKRGELREVEAMVSAAAEVVELWLSDRDQAVEMAARRGKDG